MDPVWLLYWLLAAIVLAPIVLIVKGIKTKPPDKNPRTRR